MRRRSMVLPVYFASTGEPITLRAPRNPAEADAIIKRIQGAIAETHMRIETVNRNLTFCWIPIKYWSWTSTVLGGLAFLSPCIKIISDMTALEGSDCSNSEAVIATGVAAGVLGLSYVTTKTIVTCKNKKEQEYIQPLEKKLNVQIEGLKRTVDLMNSCRSEARLIEWMKEVLKLKGVWFENEDIKEWLYVLSQNLEGTSKIKRYMKEYSRFTMPVFEPLEETKLKPYSDGESASSEYTDPDMEVVKHHHKKHSKKHAKHTEERDDSDQYMEEMKPSKKHSKATFIDLKAQVEEKSVAEDSPSDPLSDSNFLDNHEADNSAAPHSPPLSRMLNMSQDQKRARLRKITEKLNKKLEIEGIL